LTGIDLSVSLLENAKFIFTTLNGLFPIFNSIEEFCGSNTDDGNATYHNNTFDLMTFRDYNITKIEIFGAKLGAFSRENKLTKDDFEMLVIAER